MKTAEEVEKEVSIDYKQKLNVDEEGGISNPFYLDREWMSEAEGIQYMPMSLYPGIFAFLQFHPSELANRDLSDYKTSKTYS